MSAPAQYTSVASDYKAYPVFMPDDVWEEKTKTTKIIDIKSDEFKAVTAALKNYNAKVKPGSHVDPSELRTAFELLQKAFNTWKRKFEDLSKSNRSHHKISEEILENGKVVMPALSAPEALDAQLNPTDTRWTWPFGNVTPSQYKDARQKYINQGFRDLLGGCEFVPKKETVDNAKDEIKESLKQFAEKAKTELNVELPNPISREYWSEVTNVRRDLIGPKADPSSSLLKSREFLNAALDRQLAIRGELEGALTAEKEQAIDLAVEALKNIGSDLLTSFVAGATPIFGTIKDIGGLAKCAYNAGKCYYDYRMSKKNSEVLEESIAKEAGLALADMKRDEFYDALSDLAKKGAKVVSKISADVISAATGVLGGLGQTVIELVALGVTLAVKVYDMWKVVKEINKANRLLAKLEAESDLTSIAESARNLFGVSGIIACYYLVAAPESDVMAYSMETISVANWYNVIKSLHEIRVKPLTNHAIKYI